MKLPIPKMKTERASNIKPAINVGCLMDIPTGDFTEGVYGEMILNGGMSFFEGIVASANMGKSNIALYRLIVAAARMGENSFVSFYDTELTVQESRHRDMIDKYTYSTGTGEKWIEGHADTDAKWHITDKNVAQGDIWFDDFKDYLKAKITATKSISVETPFRSRDGITRISIPQPTFAALDTLSSFTTETLTKMSDKASLGDSKFNTSYMKGNGNKTRLVDELPPLCLKSSTYLTCVAHLAEKIDVSAGPFAPQSLKILPGLTQNLKFVGAPRNFASLTASCWWIIGSSPLTDDKDYRKALYPRDDDSEIALKERDKDLNLVSLYQLRGKAGASDLVVHLIFSKADGVLPSLSEYHFLKTNEYYGLGGNNVNHYCVFYPEVKITRPKVRGLLDRDAKLRRAINICSEMLQMKQMLKRYSEELLCSPESLYEDIKNLGYDWDMLLQTRGWWTIEGQFEDLPFLSTLDLLRIRKGEYHPYWLASDKKTILKPSQYKRKYQ